MIFSISRVYSENIWHNFVVGLKNIYLVDGHPLGFSCCQTGPRTTPGRVRYFCPRDLSRQNPRLVCFSRNSCWNFFREWVWYLRAADPIPSFAQPLFCPPSPRTHLWNPVFQSQIQSQTSHCQETRVVNPLVRYQVKFQVHWKFKKKQIRKIVYFFFDRMRWVLKLTFQLRFKENARKHKLRPQLRV